MVTVVIPFAGVEGKTRLHASRRVRQQLSLAMLGDVLAAALAVGTVRVATSDRDGAELARDAGAEPVRDPGGGPGAAVEAALAGLEPGAIVIEDVDTIDDLRRLHLLLGPRSHSLLAGLPAEAVR